MKSGIGIQTGRVALILTALIALAPPSWAGGSLGLDEVLEAVKTSSTLVAEIRAELDQNSLKADGVVCVGSRFGNQWNYLGGARAAPYECEIGKRTLSIEADQLFFDAKGKSLGDIDKASPKRAKTFKESNFKWTWAP